MRKAISFEKYKGFEIKFRRFQHHFRDGTIGHIQYEVSIVKDNITLDNFFADFTKAQAFGIAKFNINKILRLNTTMPKLNVQALVNKIYPKVSSNVSKKHVAEWAQIFIENNRELTMADDVYVTDFYEWYNN